MAKALFKFITTDCSADGISVLFSARFERRPASRGLPEVKKLLDRDLKNLLDVKAGLTQGEMGLIPLTEIPLITNLFAEA